MIGCCSRRNSSSLPQRSLVTFSILIVDAVLSVRVGRLTVVDVKTIQVGELGKEVKDGLLVVRQVGHLAVKKVQTLQLWQLFLEGKKKDKI